MLRGSIDPLQSLTKTIQTPLLADPLRTDQFGEQQNSSISSPNASSA
jgi:hypothetical protein